MLQEKEKLKINNIPLELKQLNNWVLWKLEKRKGKYTKIPYQINNKFASSTDSKTWTSFEKAIEIFNSRNIYSGIGFMFSNSGITGIDIDHCINENDVISDLAQYYINSFDSYTERSQSGNGIHILIKGHIPKAIKKDIEVYSEGRYFAITGNKLQGDTVKESQDLLDTLYKNYHEDSPETNISHEAKADINLKEQLNKAFNSKNGNKIKALFEGNWQGLGYQSQSEADQALCNYLAFWLNKDFYYIDEAFKNSGLYRDKWDREDYKNWTINKAIASCNKSYQELIEGNLEEYIKAYDFSNKGLLDRFLDKYKGNIKYVSDIGMYIFWDGKKWTIEDDKKLGHMITNFIYELIDNVRKYINYLKLFNRDDDIEAFTKINNKLKSLSVVKVIKENFINVSEWLLQKDLDGNDDILNCENGILDLNTWSLKPHDSNYYCTKMANVKYDSSAKCPNFLSSLDWIFPNQDTRKELQKAFGYSLGGGMGHQVFFILWGGGENGKSTIMDPLKDLLGDYYNSLNARSLEPRKDNTAPSSDLAKLIGSRFVAASEPSKGQRLDDGQLKTLAVGEEINARFMRQNEFTYNPKFKLWIPTNSLPIIVNTEHGFWRRIIIFHCINKPKHRILEFYQNYIKPSELSGILNWALEGRKILKKEGFNPTNEMAEALQEYKIKVNPLEDFVLQCCIKDELEKVQTNVLLQAYNVWALNEGHSEIKIRTFRDRFVDMGYEVRKSDKNKSYVLGLNLLKELNFTDPWSYQTSLEKMDKNNKSKIIPMQNKMKI